MRNVFYSSGCKIRDLKKDDHLFSDPNNDYDPAWIKSELIKSSATTIIIVGYIELVRWFPTDLGKAKNWARAGEGIFIGDGDVEDILRDEK